MQYRTNFVIWTVAQFLIVGTEFWGIWALFARFGGLKDWKIPEICLLYGIVNISFALAEMGGRGFDQFSGIIKSGDFDRFLLRPRPTALLLAGQIFELTRLGRALMGITILTYGILNVDISWTLAKMALLVGAIIGGTCLFYGILILQATLCFWTVESLEVVNTVTYGGITAAEMPLTIYPKGLRYLFTYIVPIACLELRPPERTTRAQRGHSVALVGFTLNGSSVPNTGLPTLAPWRTPLHLDRKLEVRSSSSLLLIRVIVCNIFFLVGIIPQRKSK